MSMDDGKGTLTYGPGVSRADYVFRKELWEGSVDSWDDVAERALLGLVHGFSAEQIGDVQLCWDAVPCPGVDPVFDRKLAAAAFGLTVKVPEPPVSGILRDLEEWRERKAKAEEAIARIEGELARADKDRVMVLEVAALDTKAVDRSRWRPEESPQTLLRRIREEGYELVKKEGR